MVELLPLVEWGPVGVWAGAIGTVLAVLVAVLVAVGAFDRFGGPRLLMTFEPVEPWCRTSSDADVDVHWVRIGVENTGRRPARGCIGRMSRLDTGGSARRDVDPLQLRWAGLPRSRAFEPVDLRPGQREYLNVLTAHAEGEWRIVTFEDPDFDPGFSTDLSDEVGHELWIAVFADNVETATRKLGVNPPSPGESHVSGLRLS